MREVSDSSIFLYHLQGANLAVVIVVPILSLLLMISIGLLAVFIVKRRRHANLSEDMDLESIEADLTGVEVGPLLSSGSRKN